MGVRGIRSRAGLLCSVAVTAMSNRRSYVGAPRVYLTVGVHEDGNWKRMWYVNAGEGRHFWTWHEAITYALSLPIPANPRQRRSSAARKREVRS